MEETKVKSKKRKIETTQEPQQSEWKEQVIQVRRVTKVVKGGKKLSFRAIVVTLLTWITCSFHSDC